LTVWNTIRSQPFDPESENTLVASELLWRTREDVASFFGEDVAESAFKLDLEEPSAVFLVAAETEDESDSYFIIMVSGRERRPLSESAIASAEQQLFQAWLEDRRVDGVEIFERWRTGVPGRPILDRRFLIPPTPAPAVPTLDIPTLEPEPPAEDGE
jgi:hypothetical protein